MNNPSGIFTPVQPLQFWTQLSVPTVFGDSLSYLEDLGKIRYKLNEVINSLNGVPALTMELIKKAFDESGIDETVRKVLAENIINAKNPPADLEPVTGDGVTDDSVNLQAIINYAHKQTLQDGRNKLVYLPSGTYLARNLIMDTNVSIMGESCYTTVLKLPDYSNVPIIKGVFSECVIGNIGLDANSNFNTVGGNIINMNVTKSVNIQNLRVINCLPSQVAMAIENVGIAMLDNIYLEGGLEIFAGDGLTSIGYLHTITAGTGLFIAQNHVNVGQYFSEGNGIALNLTGSYCTIFIMDSPSTGNVINNGVANNIIFPGENMTFSADTLDISSNITRAKLGDLSINGNTSHKDITGESYSHGGSIVLDSDTYLDTTAAHSLEIVTNKKVGNYGDLDLVAAENITASAQALKINAYNITASAQYITASAQRITATAQVLTKTAETASLYGKNVHLKADNLNLTVRNPITYKTPQVLDEYFDYIPFRSPDGKNYQVLVFNGKPFIPGGGEAPTEIVSPLYVNVKDLGAKGDGLTDDTQAFINAGQRNGFIFVPYGTYLVTNIHFSAAIKGLLSEMATIKSNSTSGNMLEFDGAWVNIQSVILDAPSAENAIKILTGGVLDRVAIRGHASGMLVISNSMINNSSNIYLTGNSRIVNSVINGNIALYPNKLYEITGNQIYGSFVLTGVNETDKIAGLSAVGNLFNPDITLADTYFTALRLAGNIGLADYPVIEIPDIPDIPTPFNYHIPANKVLQWDGDTNVTMSLDANGNFIISRGDTNSVIVSKNNAITTLPTIATDTEITYGKGITFKDEQTGKIANLIATDAGYEIRYGNDSISARMNKEGVWEFLKDVIAPNIKDVPVVTSNWGIIKVNLPLEAANEKKATLNFSRIPGLKELYEKYTEDQRLNVIVITVIAKAPGDYYRVAYNETQAQNPETGTWSTPLQITNSSDIANLQNVRIQTLNVPDVYQYNRTQAYSEVTQIEHILFWLDLNSSAGEIVVPDPEPAPTEPILTTDPTWSKSTTHTAYADTTNRYGYPSDIPVGAKVWLTLTDYAGTKDYFQIPDLSGTTNLQGGQTYEFTRKDSVVHAGTGVMLIVDDFRTSGQYKFTAGPVKYLPQ